MFAVRIVVGPTAAEWVKSVAPLVLVKAGDESRVLLPSPEAWAAQTREYKYKVFADLEAALEFVRKGDAQ
jgi:hypothetical protein